MYWLKKSDYILLGSLTTLFTFLTLFVFRELDNNRLVSWKWVFNCVNVTEVFFILIAGIIIAYGISRLSFSGRYTCFLLFGLSFSISAIFWCEPEVILDSSRYFTQAKHLKLYGIKSFINEWGSSIHVWTDLPLMPFIYGIIFKLFGESRIYIQVLITMMFSATVVLTYLIGRILWDENIGTFAGLALLGMPFVFTQIPTMLVDVPTMFFLTFAIFTFIKALEPSGRIWLILLGAPIALFCAFFVKYSTWLMLSVCFIISLIYLKEGAPKTINRTGAIMIITGIMIGMVVLFRFDTILSQIQLLTSYQAAGLRRWQEDFVSTFFFQIHPFITILAIYSVYVALKKRDLRYGIISYLILLLIIGQVERSRYTIPILPMFALMASYGASSIRNMEFKRFMAACIIISSLVIAKFAYLPFLQKTGMQNLKDAGEYLNSIEEKNVVVYTLPFKGSMINPAVFVPILDIYTDKHIYFQPDKSFSPPQERIKRSSLRFTWEYRNPEYYVRKGKCVKDDTAIVVISNGIDEFLPDYISQNLNGYHVFRTFATHEGIFRTRIYVRVYRHGNAASCL